MIYMGLACENPVNPTSPRQHGGHIVLTRLSMRCVVNGQRQFPQVSITDPHVEFNLRDVVAVVSADLACPRFAAEKLVSEVPPLIDSVPCLRQAQLPGWVRSMLDPLRIGRLQ
jgi:hypothetical protein